MYNIIFSMIEDEAKPQLFLGLGLRTRRGSVSAANGYDDLRIIVSNVPVGEVADLVSLGLNVAGEIRIDKLS